MVISFFVRLKWIISGFDHQVAYYTVLLAYALTP